MTQRQKNSKGSTGRRIIGCIGAGQIVREQHFPVLAALPGVEIAWVADIDFQATFNLAKVYGCTSVLPGKLDDNLFNQVDIVLVAAPYGVRASYYDRLQFGFSDLAFFIEKPLARTVADHQRIANLRPQHRIACDFFRRATPVVTCMKRLIADNLLGPLRECRFGLGGVGGYSVGEKYYGNPEMAGGGMLLEVGVHCLDAILFCTSGSPVGRVTGHMIMDNGFDIHTAAMTMVALGNGAEIPFSFEVSLLKETSGHLEFIFDQHVVTFSLFNEQGIRVKKIGGKTGFTLAGEAPPLSGRQALASFWLRYFEALDTGVANETCAASSLGVTCLVEAAYSLAGQSSVLLSAMDGPAKTNLP